MTKSNKPERPPSPEPAFCLAPALPACHWLSLAPITRLLLLFDCKRFKCDRRSVSGNAESRSSVTILSSSMDKLNEEIARKKREREEARAGSTLKTGGKYAKMGIASKAVAAAAALPESKVSLQSSDSSSSLAVKAKPKTRKVLVYADRVTFTVQCDVAITSAADDAENPHLRMLFEWKEKTKASKYDGPEAKWLKEFTKHVRDHDRKLRRCPTHPAVQAFYHSSALPLPSTTGLNDLGDSNGLIGACLMAFTRHKRLVLRPDDIFFPLLDAAATHVFQNGEASRNVFVGHSGKKVHSSQQFYLYSHLK